MLLNIFIFISVLRVFSIIGKNSIYLMLESNSSVQNSYLSRATHRGKLSHIQGKQALTISFQDNYLDAYVRVIKETDPTKTSLVFSCGMGAVRTTYAMVAALLVRRKQIMALGYKDPFMVKGANTPSGFSTV